MEKGNLSKTGDLTQYSKQHAMNRETVTSKTLHLTN